jgi:hypothetical protein
VGSGSASVFSVGSGVVSVGSGALSVGWDSGKVGASVLASGCVAGGAVSAGSLLGTPHALRHSANSIMKMSKVFFI